MRQVSLRKFKNGIAELSEPIEVSLRDGQGNIRVLGFWTPYATPEEFVHEHRHEIEALKPLDLSPRLEISVDEPVVIRTPEEVATAVRGDPIRAVPKPSQRGKRR